MTIDQKTEVIPMHKMCLTKISVMQSAYVPDNLLYCRNCCEGFNEPPCPHGLYRSVENTGTRFKHLRLYVEWYPKIT